VKSTLAAGTPIALAAIGGAFAMYGSYDDSPGGTLLGIIVVLGAMVCGARRARAEQSHPMKVDAR
jgi:hypothetical protein